MFDGLRKSARDKIQRAVAEIVSDSERRTREALHDEHDKLRAELSETGQTLAQVQSELAAVQAEVAKIMPRTHELEHRARRDIMTAFDEQAVNQSAAFVVQHMPKAPIFWHPHDTLRHGLAQVHVDGMALEFGVASGATLQIIVDELKDAGHEVFGFDTFAGLPETWRTGYPAGEFAQDEMPEVRGATLIRGMFEDTLSDFLTTHPGPVCFVHFDADLYSSTKVILDRLDGRLVPGTVLVFDEFFNYPGWQKHEYRAWTEYVDHTGVGFEYLGYTGDNEQVIMRITSAAPQP
jgi:hypothetical protein